MRIHMNLLAGIPVSCDADGMVNFNLMHAAQVFQCVEDQMSPHKIKKGMSANSYQIGLHYAVRQHGVTMDEFMAYVGHMQ